VLRRCAQIHETGIGNTKLKDEPDTQQWLSGPFFKAVRKVSPQEFERAKSVDDHVAITESALDNQEIAIAFAPRQAWPKMFQFLPGARHTDRRLVVGSLPFGTGWGIGRRS